MLFNYTIFNVSTARAWFQLSIMRYYSLSQTTVLALLRSVLLYTLLSWPVFSFSFIFIRPYNLQFTIRTFNSYLSVSTHSFNYQLSIRFNYWFNYQLSIINSNRINYDCASITLIYRDTGSDKPGKYCNNYTYPINYGVIRRCCSTTTVQLVN